MDAAEALFELRRRVGIMVRHGGPPPLFEVDAHSLGDGCRRTQNLLNCVSHRSASSLAWLPPGNLVARTSARLPSRNILFRPEQSHPRDGAQSLHVHLVPTLDYTRNYAVRLHQEHAGNAGDAVPIAGREVFGIQQRGKADTETSVEF